MESLFCYSEKRGLSFGLVVVFVVGWGFFVCLGGCFFVVWFVGPVPLPSLSSPSPLFFSSADGSFLSDFNLQSASELLGDFYVTVS